MISLRSLAVMLLVFLVAACATDPDDQATGDTASEPSPVATEATSTAGPQAVASPSSLQPSEGFSTATITLSDGDERIPMPVWVAADAPSRQRGLMGREALPADAGMLFVFETPSVGGFWMKNTLIPLSVAFIDENGQVLQVLDMQPCTADPCEIYSPDPASPYLYAVEANLGYFDDHGIGPGWSVDLDDALGETR
jgi:uncharacterized membrane protein (UPF0127 family)